MTPKRRLLQIPPGTEGFYLEEAFRHRRILSDLDRLLTAWGYLPAETPVFDFYDIYRPLLDESADERVYRLMDREGDLLLLRSDVTLFLAKQMGMALTEEDLPVRVWYADSILRHQQREDISKNEFYQLGAELIGIGGIAGDTEILLIANEILSFLELDAVLHLGSAGLVHEAASGLPLEEAREFFTAVALRDHEAVAGLLRRSETGNLPVPPELFDFIGTPAEFAGFITRLDTRLPKALRGYLDHLGEVAAQLESAGAADRLRIDLSETGSQAYHTGIVFQAYLEGVDSAFLSGGRYDKLLDTFGFDSPSVGFSLLLRKIEPLVGGPERFGLPGRTETADGETLAEKYRDAAAKRAAGRIVTL
jgi:ATP phosphoribosyltransferase regulatory subunit